MARLDRVGGAAAGLLATGGLLLHSTLDLPLIALPLWAGVAGVLWPLLSDRPGLWRFVGRTPLGLGLPFVVALLFVSFPATKHGALSTEWNLFYGVVVSAASGVFGAMLYQRASELSVDEMLDERSPREVWSATTSSTRRNRATALVVVFLIGFLLFILGPQLFAGTPAASVFDYEITPLAEFLSYVIAGVVGVWLGIVVKEDTFATFEDGVWVGHRRFLPGDRIDDYDLDDEELVIEMEGPLWRDRRLDLDDIEDVDDVCEELDRYAE